MQEQDAYQYLAAVGLQSLQNQGHETANLVKQTDPEKDLMDLEQTFRGKLWDAEKQEYVKQEKIEPYLDESGIFHIMTRLRAIINNNTRFANLSERKVDILTESFANEMTDYLTMTWRKHKVAHSRLKPLVNMTADMVHMILLRAMNNGEKDLIKKTTSSNESVSRVETINPRKFLSWRRGG